MKIIKNVEAPTRRDRYGEVTTAILDFIDSTDKNIKFECENKDEARRVYSSAGGAVRTMNLPVRVMKSALDIYVVRKAD